VSENGAVPAHTGDVDLAFWRGRRVLLSGHTGFKGAWMALWLQSLEANVTGYSLATPAERSLFELAGVGDAMENVPGDVRDPEGFVAALERTRPQIVIHMAAQALVRRSFAQPRETYETNVMGTVNVLDAVRVVGGVRAVVIVTSDKCYENRASERGHREDDPLGGFDPYSSSKGCAELVTQAFRRSYFAEPGSPRVASARAGNVIGGGDWGEDRLIPDLMRAALDGSAAHVRNPDAIRPWQHVLNPLSGYLTLAQALCESDAYARAWNFGPQQEDARTVGWVAARVAERWPGGLEWSHDPGPHPHEAHWLKLDSSMARTELGWRSQIPLERALDATVDWYRELAEGADMRTVTLGQIEALQPASTST